MLYHPTRKTITRHPVQAPIAGLDHLPPLLQRIYTARRLNAAGELDRSLARLPSPFLLSGMDAMVERLESVLRRQEKLLVVADYDADGATACSVALLGLRWLGAERLDYLVPSRFGFGYGLTPELVAVAATRKPDVLLTVDNGISSIDGVRAAHEYGLEVLITDHHLPGQELPSARAIVNPGLPGNSFPGRCLAGVGVMFFVLLALRQKLRESGWFVETGRAEPNISHLLDLVALGTVADVVPLDHVNRILVHQGLLRIHKGQARPGLLALLAVAGRNPMQTTATELAFSVAPRLNAAGRMEDMSPGIECLLTEDATRAGELAQSLDSLNQARREVEEQMKQDALDHLDSLAVADLNQSGLCLQNPAWHQGVIGILAARLKDRLHRPVIVFAPAGEDELKGSARSIEGVHIRDVLSDLATAHPGLLVKFGGHAMAAGLSLRPQQFDRFSRLFDAAVASRLTGMTLEQVLVSDGSLTEAEIGLELAEALNMAGPWGQGFAEPLFDGEFEVLDCRILKERHLKFMLRVPGSNTCVDGIAFSVENPAAWVGCSLLRMAYRLDVNQYRGRRTVQFRVEYMEAGTSLA